jgi:hypothetical protein
MLITGLAGRIIIHSPALRPESTRIEAQHAIEKRVLGDPTIIVIERLELVRSGDIERKTRSFCQLESK